MPTDTARRTASRPGVARAIDMIRTGEKIFRELGLSKTDDDEDTLIAAMADHPALIERPIVFARMAAPPSAARPRPCSTSSDGKRAS